MREKVLIHLFIKGLLVFANLGLNNRPNTNPFQRILDFFIRVLAQRIGVEPDGITEEERILGQAAESLADQGPRNDRDILAVQSDLAVDNLGHSEQGLDK
jgi:hypothetical protein